MPAILPNLSRQKFDIERFTFVFNQSDIVSYVNYSLNSYVSFKVNLYLLNHTITRFNGVGDVCLDFKNETIFLDCVDEICLDVVNFPFNIDLDLYYEYMQSAQTCEVAKNLLREIMSSIASQTYWIQLAGYDPITNQKLVNPIFVIKLNHNYNDLLWIIKQAIIDDLSSILYFISDKSLTIVDRYAYIECNNEVSPTRLINVAFSYESGASDYVIQTLNSTWNIFLRSLDIKNNVIKRNYQLLDNKSWLDVIFGLTECG